MRKNHGFTLSEVLIALAVIGTVAALTIPALMTNVQNQQMATGLAKAYNTLENANKLALADNSARTLNSINGVGDNYINLIRRYVAGTGIDNVPNYASYNDHNDNSNPGNGYLATDGIAYYTNAGISNDFVLTNTLNYCSGASYSLTVDVNGPIKGPNVYGIDAFNFLIDTRGSVIPQGGALYTDYTGVVGACARDAVGTGHDCAGSIVDNGWKVVYR